MAARHTAPPTPHSRRTRGGRLLAYCALLAVLLTGCAADGTEEPPDQATDVTATEDAAGEDGGTVDVAEDEERWKLTEGGSGSFHTLIINFAGGADGRVSVEVFGETIDGEEIDGEFIGGRAGESVDVGGYTVTFEEVNLEESPAYAWLSVVPAEE